MRGGRRSVGKGIEGMRLLSGGASDGMLVEVVLEAFAVTVAYGHVLLPEDYLATLYHLNALHVDDYYCPLNF